MKYNPKKSEYHNTSTLVNLDRACYETNHNTLLGTFRFIDNVTKKTTPELINYFNSPNILKHQEKVIKESDLSIYKYLKGWNSPYGYAPWPWVINWLARMRNEGFAYDELGSFLTGEGGLNGDCINYMQNNLSNETTSPRLGSNAESHLIADEFIENKGEPIYLAKKMVEAFYHTDIQDFNPIENEVLPSLALMIPRGAYGTEDPHSSIENNLSGTKTNVLTLLVITNKCWRRRLKQHLYEIKEFDKNRGKDPEIMEAFINNMFDKNNYLCNPIDAYMFDAGFKVLALDDKCGGALLDFNWKSGTKGLRFLGKGGKLIDQDPDGKRYTNYYKGILNIAANSILHISHQTEYVTKKAPLIARGTGFSNEDEITPQPATWIGENYHQPKTKYEYPVGHIPIKGKSPRPHWRKGHYKYICQGPGRKQRVLKWIKPVYVNGAKAS